MKIFFNIHKLINKIYNINKLKEKTYSHLNRCRESFQQNSIVTYDKNLWKIVIEGTYHSIIKVRYDKTIANVILNVENLKAFSLRSGTRQWCTLPALLFNMCFGSPSLGNEKRKGDKRPIF